MLLEFTFGHGWGCLWCCSELPDVCIPVSVDPQLLIPALYRCSLRQDLLPGLL